MASLTTLLFPAVRRHLPYSRWWNIAARTIHLAATGMLLGAHVYGVPADGLYPLLWTAIATGGVMIAIEVYPSAHWTHQICAVFVYVKVALLCAIPFMWDYRVPMLIAVVGLASIGSHAPRKVRHYSLWYRRVMID